MRSAKPNLRRNQAFRPPKEFDFGIVISAIELRTTFVITEVTRGVPRGYGIHRRRAALVPEGTKKNSANLRSARPNLRQHKAFWPPKEFDFGIVMRVNDLIDAVPRAIGPGTTSKVADSRKSKASRSRLPEARP